MAEEIRPVDAADAEMLGRIVELIAGQQAQRERHIVYVGEEAKGIRAELDALEPPWTDTVRVVVGAGDAPIAVTLAEWDEQLGRAWIFGPWIDGDDELWGRWARPLVDAQLA